MNRLETAHHCPSCGEQPCTAASKRIHICPLCGTRWEETLRVPLAHDT